MKRIALVFTAALCAGPVWAQSAESLDLRVPEPANAYAAGKAGPAGDPPGTYYGDTSGKPSRAMPGEVIEDDGKAKVWGSFTTGIGHTKGYGTSHYNAAEVNVSKSFGDGERSNTVNMSIRVEQSDGPGFGQGFGGRYPYYAPDAGYPFPPR